VIPVIRAKPAKLATPVQRVLKVFWEELDLLVQRAPKVTPVPKGPKGPKVKLEARVQLVHMDILATPEQLGPRVQPAQKEVLVKLATQVQLEILAPKGRKVLRAQRVRKVRKVILVCKVQLVLKAQLDQLVCKETPAILD